MLTNRTLQFRRLEPSELPEGVQHGASFTCILIDTPHYLPYLLKRFKSKGGVTYRANVPDIVSALSVSPELASADAIVHSTGLGARETVGDKDVFPTRGQLVIVRAPWIKGGITRLGKGVYTYTIPRKSRDLVVIGGSADPNDWSVALVLVVSEPS
jgi:D-amino-acid oxidase